MTGGGGAPERPPTGPSWGGAAGSQPPRTSFRSWPGWSWRPRAPLGWGSGSRFPLGRGRSQAGRWAGVPHLPEAVWAGATAGTHWGAWGRWAAVSRPCGAGAGPAQQPRAPAGPGPGPGPGRQPVQGLRGGGACWGGVHGRKEPPAPLPLTPLLFGVGGGPCWGQARPPYPWGTLCGASRVPVRSLARQWWAEQWGTGLGGPGSLGAVWLVGSCPHRRHLSCCWPPAAFASPPRCSWGGKDVDQARHTLVPSQRMAQNWGQDEGNMGSERVHTGLPRVTPASGPTVAPAGPPGASALLGPHPFKNHPPHATVPDWLPPTPSPKRLPVLCSRSCHRPPCREGALIREGVRVSLSPWAWAGASQAPHSSLAGRQVGGGWARAEQGLRLGAGGVGGVGRSQWGGAGGGIGPRSSLPAASSSQTCHPVPRPHSLGPGLAGLVVARGEVSRWAPHTVCNKASRLHSSAAPRGRLDAHPTPPETPLCLRAALGVLTREPHPRLCRAPWRGGKSMRGPRSFHVVSKASHPHAAPSPTPRL